MEGMSINFLLCYGEEALTLPMVADMVDDERVG